MTDANEHSTLDRLIRPRSIAVVGASAEANKTAGRPIAFLQKHGFNGAIYPVNPRAAEIAGLACYANAAALPEAPDVGLVLVGAERVPDALRDLAKRGTRAAIVLADGFAEAGADGVARQAALLQAAGSMRLLGPNTIGLVNLTDGITLAASSALEIDQLHPGHISLVSQSGGILGSLLSRAAGRGVGLARLIGTGNEADIDLADIVDYLAGDAETRVIAIYMEGLRNLERFRRAAAKARAAGKLIVAYKIGRSDAGVRSAQSHTGALAGADRMFEALARQLGIIRAATFADLIDIPATIAMGRQIKGNRVAVLTSSGGAGALIADACGVAGLDLPAPDAATAERLAMELGTEAASAGRNPVDVTLAGLDPRVFKASIAALLASASYDALIVVVGSSGLARPTMVADAAAECLKASDKPLLVYVSPEAPHIVRLLNAQNIPAFSAPESPAQALGALSALADRVDPQMQAPIEAGPALAPLPTGALNEAESKALFARFGIVGARETIAATPQAAEMAAREMGVPFVLKLLSRHVLHKSEHGGVRIGLGIDEVAAACNAMTATLARAKRPAPEGFLVQERINGGVEMILGLVRDPQFGPGVLVGLGGTLAELFDDTAIALLPVSRADAAAMVARLKSRHVLEGYRGAPIADTAALIDAIVAFARFAEAAGEALIEAEINPLFVLPAGQGVCAADGVAIFR